MQLRTCAFGASRLTGGGVLSSLLQELTGLPISRRAAPDLTWILINETSCVRRVLSAALHQPLLPSKADSNCKLFPW